MIANYHTHTSRCHHAVGQDEEYVLAAIEKGLKILGFSDHTPHLFFGDYVSRSRMLPQELQGYCDSIRSLKQAHGDKIQLHLGVEAEYYPDLWQDDLSLLRDHGIEYMILAQHWTGNEMSHPYVCTPSDDKDRLIQYCRTVCAAMETGLFSYLAHPDVIRFTGDEALYQTQMRTICRTAKQCGVPLEINLLGIRENRHYPTPAFWPIAAEEGCNLVLGIDAHAPAHIADTTAEATALEMVQHYGLTLLPTVELRKL